MKVWLSKQVFIQKVNKRERKQKVLKENVICVRSLETFGVRG